ncbi:MAG: M14 family zinc carboxypeptidase [Gemmatimonadota bacterium]
MTATPSPAELLASRLPAILDAAPAPPDADERLGVSRENRPIRGFRFGRGPLRVSLLGGCHADEPTGPRLLRRLATHLGSLPPGDPLLERCEWWILPHLNPDGEARNRPWQTPGAPAYDLPDYLLHAQREAPGDDIEFGFPRGADDEAARPENRAALAWWRESAGPFALHASLHGMAFGGGPWFLVERAWSERCDRLMGRCVAETRALGYRLHDVDRRGEKGFDRLGPGFATRPDSRAMRAWFEARGDYETAGRFRPSSMESVRALGGDPLTVVSEMPLFVTPGVGERLGPPDPAAETWRERIEAWRRALHEASASGDALEETTSRVRREAAAAGLSAMPVHDQMTLQWTLVSAGIDEAARAAG